jgi:hypothetical protein
MHRDHHIFIEAIKHKKKVSITTLENSKNKRCRPLFYIPDNEQNGQGLYYVWDGEKGEKGDISWLAPEQIVSIEPTQEPFDPAGFTLKCDEERPLNTDSSDLLRREQ